MLGPVRDVFIEHQTLSEQGMCTVLRRVRPEPSVTAKALSRCAQHREQGDGQSTEQEHSVSALGGRYAHRRKPHPEAHVLDVAKARLNPPSLGVVANQRARGNLAFTGRAFARSRRGRFGSAAIVPRCARAAPAQAAPCGDRCQLSRMVSDWP